jgi:cytoskeletal protein CcmA (bactofilin family)
MAENEAPPEAQQDDVDALETPEQPGGGEATPESSRKNESTVDATSSNSGNAPKPPEAPPKSGGLKQRLRKFNIYLLMFGLVLVIAGGIVTIAYFQSKKAQTSSTIKTQTLTNDLLNQLANSDATVGSDQQVLKVESSAIFAGKVLIRNGLDVAGNLQIGGTVSLSNIAVSGTAQFAKAQVNDNLSVAGDTAVQGGATIAKSLQVSSGGSFGGPLTAPQITTSSLQLNGDLVLTHHIIAGGPTPGRTNGTALGSGGTAAVSGSDTGGTVTINVGTGAGAGCFITVNFSQKYNSTPRVLITPVGSSAAGLAYYVNRTSTSFSICDATPPPAGASFGFDYFVFN